MALFVSSVVIIALVTVMYLVSFWASASNLSSSRTIDKLSAYECGLEPVGDARMKFEILYCTIGISMSMSMSMCDVVSSYPKGRIIIITLLSLGW